MDETPIVVIDTTAFFNAPLLGGKRWPELLEHCIRGSLVLVVPEVVIQEAVRHQKRASLTAIKKLTELNQCLRQAGGTEIDVRVRISELEKQRTEYEEWLRSALTDSGVKIHPHPQISHQQLTEWAMLDRQPFKPDETGYRDALIWATVLEIAEAADPGPTIYLISANKKDFSQDGTLAEALQADLDNLPHSPEVVWKMDFEGLLLDLSEYLLAARSPSAPVSVPLRTEMQLIRSAVAAQPESLLGLELATFHDDERSDKLDLDLPPELESPTIQDLEIDLGSLVWDAHDRYEGGTVIGEATVDAEISVDGFIHVSEWEPESGFVALDPNWNDHYVWASLDIRAELTFSLNVNPETEEVEDAVLVGVTRI